MASHRPSAKVSLVVLLLAAAAPARSVADVEASANGVGPPSDAHFQPSAPPALPIASLAPPDRAEDAARTFTVPAVEALGVQLAIMSWNRWIGAAPWADVSAGSIGRNLRSRWVLDDDQFWVNQLGHPYQGTWAFTAARSAGLGFWPSAAYSFAGSALWEIAGETERPSLNDQVTTTVAGVVLGEILTRFSGALRAEGGAWRRAAASVLSPMSALNRDVVGSTWRPPTPASRWELSLGAASGSIRGGAWRGRAAFDFTWGLPGDPDLELVRPFDHFVIEAAYAADPDPDATVRARGLLAGATFGASPEARGLYGAFVSFDFDTPGRYRVSTSAVGVGASARLDLSGGVALEGDVQGAAVLLGAAAAVARGSDGEGRDYLIGPGAQGLLDVAVVAGSRVRAGVALRPYLLLGEGEPGGTALLVEASARATLRIAGPHGLSVEATRHVSRTREDSRGLSRVADSAIQVSYVLLGGAPSPGPRAVSPAPDGGEDAER